MASAYAAVVSLQHIIENIHLHHSTSHLKSLCENPRIETLRIRASFLQKFLEEGCCYRQPGACHNDEGYSAAEGLERRIADVAHATEDILESHVVDRIHVVYSSRRDSEESSTGENDDEEDYTSISHEEQTSCEEAAADRVLVRDPPGNDHEENKPSDHFDQSLERVIKDMDLIIEEEVKKFKVEKTETNYLEQQPINTFVLLTSSTATPPGTEKYATHMVGFGEYLNQVMEKLTGQGLNRQVIPIFGMGDIGKTTLAANVRVNPLIKQYFDRHAWATISQQYSVREILAALLSDITGNSTDNESPEDRIGERLHKELCGRRYLIILDDMWSIEAWDKVKLYLPDRNDGSRVIITTRISSLASHFGSCGLNVGFLKDDESWDLLKEIVFGDGGHCRDTELEKLGRMIADKCKGLPLSIVTIGGLLAKSNKTIEHWERVLENLNSIVASDGNEHCLKILSLTYRHLPVHLKPCFLYMGVFPEDYTIHVSRLIKLWVAEGFLTPNRVKSLEEVVEECLHELISRNLIVGKGRRSSGKVKTCSIHDLLRELCLKESEKEKFCCVVNTNAVDSREMMKSWRRLAIHGENPERVICVLESTSLLRSLTCQFQPRLSFQNFGLLRVLNSLDEQDYQHDALQLFNACYLRIDFIEIWAPPSSIKLLWNLQAFYVTGAWGMTLPSEIWEMPQLRHIRITRGRVNLAQPPIDGNVVLGNLQSVTCLLNFECTEQIARKIPNIRKLEDDLAEYYYVEIEEEEDESSGGCRNKLHLLNKLESLTLSIWKDNSPKFRQQQVPTFPLSLKKLHLSSSRLPWESITVIGVLPHLEVLELEFDAFTGDEWNAVDQGEIFCSLKILKIAYSESLEHWTADEMCFPCLEHLDLQHMDELVEIPSGIGDIPTLQSIFLRFCKPSVFDSAKRILEEQRSFGNDTLQILTDDPWFPARQISVGELQDESHSEWEDESVSQSEAESQDETVSGLESVSQSEAESQDEPLPELAAESEDELVDER